MSSLNIVMLIGNLVRDPDMHNGTTPILSFTVATSEKYRTKTGENKEVTDYNKVKLFGSNALELHPQLHKGSKVFVEGRAASESYKDKDGNAKSGNFIKATDIRVYPAITKASETTRTGGFSGGGGDDDEDIPF